MKISLQTKSLQSVEILYLIFDQKTENIPKGIKMKNLLLTTGIISIVLFLMSTKILEGNPSQRNIKVFRLKQNGWKVFDQNSFVESRQGLAPYQNLRRDVQVIEYRLEKDEKIIICVVEYDSQRDLITDSCNDLNF